MEFDHWMIPAWTGGNFALSRNLRCRFHGSTNRERFYEM